MDMGRYIICGYYSCTPTGEPTVTFPVFEGDEVVAVYAYCTLHGLFKA